MSFDSEIYKQAEKEITERRLSAESTANRHIEEIESKIPEIAEINRQLAGTSIEICKLILNKKDNIQESIETLKNNNLEGQKMIKTILCANGYPQNYMQPQYKCLICKDTGFIDGKRCSCFNNLLEKFSIERLNQNSQIKLFSFDTFDLNYYPKSDVNGNNCYQQMSNIFNYCKNYVKIFSLNSNSIFMLGLTGLGKTHLSLSIAKEVLEKGFNVAYDSTLNFLRKIEKEHFGKENTDTLSLLLNVDLLIMDDLGSEYDSSFYASTIYNIINSRLNKGLPTIINSNLSPSELQKKYDDRIISRLFAMFDYLKFTGIDIRQFKKQNVRNSSEK